MTVCTFADGKLFKRWRLLLVVATAGAFTSLPAQSQVLSGTIHYSGSYCAVSADCPIRIFAFDGPTIRRPIQSVGVDTNGGAYQITLPGPDSYYLDYVIGAGPAGENAVGKPFEIYKDKGLPPGDRIDVSPAGLSGLALEFDDSSKVSGIAGTVDYTGSKGSVSADRPLTVAACGDPECTGEPDYQSPNVVSNGGRFDLITLDHNPYYLRASFDPSGNGATAICSNSIEAGPAVTNVLVTFGDDGMATCTGTSSTPIPSPTGPSPTPGAPTATPTPTPTPTITTPSGCVGDCNGDGMVGVNEIILLVNFALGTLTNCAACPSGIPADVTCPSGINVSLIIKAVNAALGTTACTG